jgi:hypothetical protein
MGPDFMIFLASYPEIIKDYVYHVGRGIFTSQTFPFTSSLAHHLEATHVMERSPLAQQPFRFLDLPVEIRLMV